MARCVPRETVVPLNVVHVVAIDLARDLLRQLEAGGDTTRTRALLKIALREVDELREARG